MLRAVSLRSSGPGSGVEGVLQFIYAIIPGVDRDDKNEFLTDNGEARGEEKRSDLDCSQ